jgi:hypothetical protein
MARNVVLTLAGVAVLVLKGRYVGPLRHLIQSWAGNVSVSFALYFIAEIVAHRVQRGRFAAAATTLLIVELFEAADGFGLMANTHDPLDYVANAVGVGLAICVEELTLACCSKRAKQQRLAGRPSEETIPGESTHR